MRAPITSILADQEAQMRFWAKVKISDDCWIWTASKNNDGYGQFGLGNGNMRPAHRISWVLKNGSIPNGMCVLHKCDNPPCVNPDHLFLGTIADNNHDRDSKGRHRPLLGKSNGMYGGKHAARGERQHLAKLTALEVLSIREILSKGGTSFLALSKRFGVSDVTISHIFKRKTWTHI